MRIDKYLKVSRLIKRRTIAKELLERGIFKINGKIAKPSSTIKEGDILYLLLGRHARTIKVLKTENNSKKENASSFYELISDEIIEDED